MTRVWPALCPPWKRTTTSALADSQSTILPLPSSPHWAPITATFAIVRTRMVSCREPCGAGGVIAGECGPSPFFGRGQAGRKARFAARPAAARPALPPPPFRDVRSTRVIVRAAPSPWLCVRGPRAHAFHGAPRCDCRAGRRHVWGSLQQENCSPELDPPPFPAQNGAARPASPEGFAVASAPSPARTGWVSERGRVSSWRVL